jgi:isoleucyl-tRNA synthetase
VKLAELGRSARSAADVKLRQPLASVTVAALDAEDAAALARLGEHLVQELNVKRLEVVRDEGALVSYSLRPVLPRLGPKYGQRVPAIRAALSEADATAVAAMVQAGQPVSLTVDGEPLELQPDEVEVTAAPLPGLATVHDPATGYVVALSTELTEELVAEGLARDVVRRIQQLRKDAGLAITDRIRLTIEAPPAVREAVDTWREYVAGETLATELTFGPPSGDMATDDGEIEGQPVRIGLRRAGAD